MSPLSNTWEMAACSSAWLPGFHCLQSLSEHTVGTPKMPPGDMNSGDAVMLTGRAGSDFAWDDSTRTANDWYFIGQEYNGL